MNTGLKMQKYGGHRECELAAGFEFYYNMDWKKFPDSDILRPHCTIPLRGADFLVQTPDGFNTRDTYTFAWWSKYVDLFAWRTSNFPMGLNGPLEQYVGREICASLFRLPLEEELKAMEADGLPPPNDWLCESQKLTFFRLKLTHSAMTEPAEAEFEDCVEWDDLEEDASSFECVDCCVKGIPNLWEL
eukprot:g23169.t1